MIARGRRNKRYGSGEVILNWSALVAREDDSGIPLSEIDKFIIWGKHTGTGEEVFSEVTGSSTSIKLTSLSVGEWEFRVSTKDVDGIISTLSQSVKRLIK